MKKLAMLGLLLGMMLAVGSPSTATVIVMNDWTLDLTGVDGLGSTVINDIRQIGFNGGIAHSTALFDPTAPPLAPQYQVDGVLEASSYKNTAGQTLSIGGTYAMTFDFSVLNQQTNAFGSDPATFTHLGVGYLNIYVDAVDTSVGNLAYTAATAGTGFGYQDGEKIATFEILPGGGGIWTAATFDGSDDATFSLVWARAGVFKDANGNDLSLLGNLLIGMTDSNFDADPEDTTPDNFNVGDTYYPNLYPNWTANTGFTLPAHLPNNTPYDYFAEEDGSARLGVVPEPSTFILLGVGLLGLGVVGRKRMRT